MKKYLVIAGAAGALMAAWALPSLADDATTATGTATAGATVTANPSTTITLDQIDKTQPFGDLAVDDSKQPADVYASLTPDQRMDLAARCNLIVPNGSQFDAAVPTWCSSYLDWQKTNHPDNQ